MKIFKKVILYTMITVLFCGNISFPVEAEETETVTDANGTGEVYDGLMEDELIFESVDTKRTSSIAYRTIGFTMSRCKVEPDNVVNYTPEYYDASKTQYISVCLFDQNGDLPEGIVAHEDTTNPDKVVTTWIIKKSFIFQTIKECYPDWYEELMAEENKDNTQYIMFDAVMEVIKYDKEGIVHHNGTMNWGTFKQAIVEGTTYGNVTLNNWTLTTGANFTKFGTPGDLVKAQQWKDPASITKKGNHFEKPYVLRQGEPIIPEPEPEEERELNEEYVTHIGKAEPYYKTYNYSDLFSLRDGIPSSEQIENGIEVDQWFGRIGIGKREVQKTYYFNLKLRWYTTHKHADGSKSKNWHSETKRYPVTKKSYYYYIWDCDLYDFTAAKVENDCFRNDHIMYMSNTLTNFYLLKDDEINPGAFENDLEWSADDDAHIIGWKDVDLSVEAEGGSSKSLAYNRAKAEAKKRLEDDFVKLKNDTIQINGKTYLDGSTVSISDGEEVPQYRDIPDSDIPLEERKSYTKIPSPVANGYYDTKLIVQYNRKAVSDDKIWSNYKTKDSAIRADAANPKWDMTLDPTMHMVRDPFDVTYLENEPIRVHTPVITPLSITMPSNDEQPWEDPTGPTQLCHPNEYALYQLLLDGTYNFHWDPEKHLEIQGYGDSGDPSKYDKYVAVKQIKFPFDVYVGGRKYLPNTWIDLRESMGEYNDFTVYIPPYAREGADHIVNVRVAPINVIDEKGVDHWEDTEYLKNLEIENYVVTYDIPVQLSGRVYGFEVVSIADEITFGDQTEKFMSEPIYNFVYRKEEKKSGIYNRVGGSDVRYTLDDTLCHAWDVNNTLPFSKGTSTKRPWYGHLFRGHYFYYTLWTMANLEDFDDDDRIEITPSFRYIGKDGTEEREVDIWYTTPKGSFIKMGSEKDLERQNSLSIWYDDFSAFKYAWKQEDADFTARRARETGYDTQMNARGWLSHETDTFSYGKITLHFTQKLLAGAEKELERNLSKEIGEYTFDDARTVQSGVYGDYYLQSGYYDKFRESMQKWYGAYQIPDYIYIVDKGTDVKEWAEEHGGISSDSEIWNKYDADEGFLILNFDIKTINDGAEHLMYSSNPFQAPLPNTTNQWKKEGQRDEVIINDGTGDYPIPIVPGDVAIIEIGKSYSDYFTSSIFMIN